MKYMILLHASQRDYDRMAGKASEGPTWSGDDVAAMHAFMESWNNDLVESGEFVEARGLAAPVHARRIHGSEDGVPVVTDGPYPETQEVLAGYTIVECDSFDRATEIASQITKSPGPGDVDGAYVDVRPIIEGLADLVE